MSSVSQILRHTREAKGITLDDVAQRTYIKLPYLAALEEGHIEDLLAPVFVHGYIRQYARLLGLNAAELVGQYQQEVRRDHPKLAPVPVLTTADAELTRVPAFALADADHGGGASNGHAAPKPYVQSPEDSPQPLASAEVELVERTVPVERSTPLSFPLDNGRAAPQAPGSAPADLEAQRLIAEAQQEAERLRREAERYAYQVLTDLEAELGRTLAIIKNGRQFLQQRRRHTAASAGDKG